MNTLDPKILKDFNSKINLKIINTVKTIQIKDKI